MSPQDKTEQQHATEKDPLVPSTNLLPRIVVNEDGDVEEEDDSSEEEDIFSSLRVLDPRHVQVPLHDVVNPSAMATTFFDDVTTFAPGSMPHSAVVGTTIGIVCGILAYLYYNVLEFLLDLIWHDLPERFLVPYIHPSLHWIWIPLVGIVMATLVGLSVQYLGEPGDLSFTVQCVHDKAYIKMDHVMPMLAASQFSILGGGSVGPEAPLVAICASFSGYISRKVFKQTHMNLIRKHVRFGSHSWFMALCVSLSHSLSHPLTTKTSTLICNGLLLGVSDCC
jgi:hypothetical protein